MGIIIRQSAVSTMLTYFGVVIGYINVLLLYPKYMDPEEVGLARIIQDAAMLFVPFAQLGVAQLVVKFFPEHNSKKSYPDFVGFVFTYLIIAILFFSGLYFVLQDEIVAYFSRQSSEVNLYLGYILALTIILSVHYTLIAFSQTRLNIILPNFLKEILLRISTLMGIVLYALGLIDFTMFVNVLLGAYLLNLLILLIYLVFKKAIPLSFLPGAFSRDQSKAMLSYSLFTFLGASGMLIVGKVDTFMVTGMLGLTETAIYTTAFYIAVLVELPKRAIDQISTPIISNSFAKNDLVEVKSVYRKSALNNMIIGSIILIGIIINLDNIFSLVPRSEIYSQGSMVVLVVGVAKLIDMSFGLNGVVLLMSKYYRSNVYFIIVLAFTTIFLNYLLIPVYGLTGAAIGSAISFLVYNILKFFYILIKLGMQPFTMDNVKALLIGVFTLFVGLALPSLDNVFLDIIFRSSIVVILFALGVYFLIPRQDLHFAVDEMINRLKGGNRGPSE